MSKKTSTVPLQKSSIAPMKREHISDQMLIQQAMYYQHPAMFFIPNFVHQPRVIQYVPILPRKPVTSQAPLSPKKMTGDLPKVVIPMKSEFTATKLLSPVRNSTVYFPLSPQSPDFLHGLSPMLLRKRKIEDEIDELIEETDKRRKLDLD